MRCGGDGGRIRNIRLVAPSGQRELFAAQNGSHFTEYISAVCWCALCPQWLIVVDFDRTRTARCPGAVVEFEVSVVCVHARVRGGQNSARRGRMNRKGCVLCVAVELEGSVICCRLEVVWLIFITSLERVEVVDGSGRWKF